MNRVARVGLIFISVVIFCYAGIGHILGKTPDDKAYKSLTVFGEVLQKIQQDYVDEPNMRTVTAGSLHGLLESLDTQSSYLTPREYALLEFLAFHRGKVVTRSMIWEHLYDPQQAFRLRDRNLRTPR